MRHGADREAATFMGSMSTESSWYFLRSALAGMGFSLA